MTDATMLWTGTMEAITFGVAKAEVDNRNVVRQPASTRISSTPFDMLCYNVSASAWMSSGVDVQVKGCGKD
jgi:hypothetical protein